MTQTALTTESQLLWQVNFDVLFAKNKILHPGEKRLVQFAKNNCKLLPEMFEENINKLFAQPNSDTLKILSNMVENIRRI